MNIYKCNFAYYLWPLFFINFFWNAYILIWRPIWLIHLLKRFCFDLAPTAPTIIPEECSAENNSVTVAWQPPPQSHVEGYVLELDDGNGGEFRVSSTCNFYVWDNWGVTICVIVCRPAKCLFNFGRYLLKRKHISFIFSEVSAEFAFKIKSNSR